MKKIFLIITTVLVLFSCKKETLSLAKQSEVTAPAGGNGNGNGGHRLRIKIGAAPLVDSSNTFGMTGDAVIDTVILDVTQIKPLSVPDSGYVFKWLFLMRKWQNDPWVIVQTGFFGSGNFIQPFTTKDVPDLGSGQYTYMISGSKGFPGTSLYDKPVGSNPVVVQKN